MAYSEFHFPYKWECMAQGHLCLQWNKHHTEVWFCSLSNYSHTLAINFFILKETVSEMSVSIIKHETKIMATYTQCKKLPCFKIWWPQSRQPGALQEASPLPSCTGAFILTVQICAGGLKQMDAGFHPFYVQWSVSTRGGLQAGIFPRDNSCWTTYALEMPFTSRHSKKDQKKQNAQNDI